MNKRSRTSLLYLLLIAFLAHPALAQEQIILAREPYAAAEEELKRFQQEFPDTLKGELGFIDVPLNYDPGVTPTMKVFFRLPHPIDPKKPSVLYFYGGPGGSSAFTSFEGVLKDFNVIYMDQRGTGFSRPPTLADLRNPSNFTSEYIANDAATLVQHLGLAKVSVYGHSYGTVVANIFASLFPELTHAAVLEGVIYTGETELWNAPHRLKLLQKFFDSLPEDLRTEILAVSASGQVPPDWFSIMGQGAMYSPNFKEEFRKLLENLLSQSDDARNKQISISITNWYTTDSVRFGAYMFHHLACQEFNAEKEASNWAAEFVNGKLIPSLKPLTPLCLTIPGMKERLGRTYYATNYPLHVPVTYVQGTWDGATTAPAAISHYKKVPRARAQLILAKKSGHSPLAGCLQESDPSVCPSPKRLQALVKRIFLGEELSPAELRLLMPNGRWVMTSKN